MRCPVHFCIGQEAVPTVLNSLLRRTDFLFSHHRSHGYYLSKNAPLKKLVAELYGKKNGSNGGLAGSQDISYPENNFFAGAILAGSIGIAVGNAFAQKLDKKNNITVVGFGESACDVGLFWESINYAFLKKLPILFICENNNYSVFSPQKKRQAGDEIFRKVRKFGKNSDIIFGNNIGTLYKKINTILKKIRKSPQPFFLEVLTYRQSSHYGPESDLNIGYRSKNELDFWKKFCPVEMFENKLIQKKIINKSFIKTINDKYLREIKNAITFSKNSEFPKKFNLNKLNYSEETIQQKKIIKVRDNFQKLNISKQKIIGY